MQRTSSARNSAISARYAKPSQTPLRAGVVAFGLLAVGGGIAYSLLQQEPAQAVRRPTVADDSPADSVIDVRLEEAWALYHAGRAEQAEGALEAFLLRLEADGAPVDHVTKVAEALEQLRNARSEALQLAEASQPKQVAET